MPQAGPVAEAVREGVGCLSERGQEWIFHLRGQRAKVRVCTKNWLHQGFYSICKEDFMGKLIGYTQGTYDMFHIGHLNLIKNAKRRCDYLIVGVNTDELVESYKHKKPIIPLEERAEIVRAIKYVDEVIITDTLDKKVIWDKIRFDEIYIGDDWKGNERWERTGRQMAELGAKLVYLPYTKDTSSTMLREKLTEY